MAPLALFRTSDLPVPESLQDAVELGEVFTRDWVVELILDLVGYTVDRDLAELRIVEPACGEGAFLGPISQRLSQSCLAHGRPITDAAKAVIGFDLVGRNVGRTRALLGELLSGDGWCRKDIDTVVSAWVCQGDTICCRSAMSPTRTSS